MKKVITAVRITELGDIANRLSVLFKNTSDLQEDVFLTQIFAEVESQGNAITEAVKRDSVLSLLEEADAKRDEAIRVLSKLLEGYKYIPVENLKKHGEKLSAIFGKYGLKIVEENYSSQSNLIDSLLLDFSAEDTRSSIAALSGIAEAIENLKNAQLAFAKIRSDYEKAKSSQKSQATASSHRKPLIELINKKLIPYLIAMNIAQSEKYAEFCANTENIISSVNEVVKARAKKGNK